MNVKLSKRVNGVAASKTLAISAKAQKMKADGASVVNFGVGEPDFSTPDFVVNAAIKALNDGKTKYTPVAGITPFGKRSRENSKKPRGLNIRQAKSLSQTERSNLFITSFPRLRKRATK